MGEAKASGNLGNTLKVLGRFDEAIVCCQRHLDIAQEQGDKVSGQTLESSTLPYLLGLLPSNIIMQSSGPSLLCHPAGRG